MGRFSQESVARVDGVGIRDLGGRDHRADVEVGVGVARRPDADVLVRELHMQLVFVRLGVHGDGLDAELAAGIDDPQGDFSAVRDQDFLEHEQITFDAETAGKKSPRISQRALRSLVAFFTAHPYRVLIAKSRSPYCTAWPFST